MFMNKPDYIIRDFTEADREQYLRMSGLFYSSDAVDHAAPSENFSRTFDQCIARNPLVRGLALEMDGVFAGFALLSITWSNEVGGLCVWLEEAYVDSAWQGQGLGSAFLSFVEEEYKNTAKRLRLEVTSVNTGAIRLYQRNGYQHLNYMQMVKDL